MNLSATRAGLGATIIVALLGLAACGVTTNSGPGAQPTATATTATTPAAFAVTSVDLAVNTSDINGTACGTSVTFTYTATFHVPAGTPGGTIQFMYTTNNGRSSTNASVNVPAGATSATYTFTTSGNLPADHTFPGVAEVIVTSPGNAQSPQVTVAGQCALGSFKVTSIDISVHPTTVSNVTCGTTLTATWTAIFHIPANTSGGTIQLDYSWNEGRASYNGSVNVPAGATAASFSFSHTDKVEPDHSFPQYGSVHVSGPNTILSQEVIPSGTCHS